MNRDQRFEAFKERFQELIPKYLPHYEECIQRAQEELANSLRQLIDQGKEASARMVISGAMTMLASSYASLAALMEDIGAVAGPVDPDKLMENWLYLVKMKIEQKRQK